MYSSRLNCPTIILYVLIATISFLMLAFEDKRGARNLLVLVLVYRFLDGRAISLIVKGMNCYS
jgi:uncharacterized membrane protein